MTVDPSATAQTWLERLPVGARLAAGAHTDARLWAWIMGGVLVVAVCLLISKTGVLVRVRRLVERERPRPWLASAVSAAVFALALMLVRAPFDALAGWREDLILQQGGGAAPMAGLAQRLGDAASGVLPAMTFSIMLIPLLHWLMRRRSRTWPWIAGALLGTVILAAGWLPYAVSSGPALAPLPPGVARAGLLRLISDTGTPASQIYVSADPGFVVDVTGAFGRAKVVVGPRLLVAPPAEIRAMTGHLMGHYAHGDVFSICLLDALLTVAGLLAIQRLYPPMARLMGVGAAGPADPEGLPVLTVIAVLAIAAATPVSSGFLRWANVRADAYSLDHAREPDGLAAGLERDWNHEDVDPSALERAIFYTHPPLKSRLLHAMAWKASNGG